MSKTNGATFEEFWKWLGQLEAPVKNLGGRSEFEIAADRTACEGRVKPRKTSVHHRFSKADAKKVWERHFYLLKLGESRILRASQYVDPAWQNCPNRICAPYLGAAIRDFVGWRNRRLAAINGASTARPEITFNIEPCSESGGFVARWDAPGGGGITTQGETLSELNSMIADAIDGYFEPGLRPLKVRLHFIEDPLLAVA